MKSIRLFMWGYQQHFQISVNLCAEQLFQKLNPEFKTEVFLLGLLRKENPQQHPVCLEPEYCEFKPEDFATLREDAAHRYQIDPERSIMTTVESHYDAIQRRAKARAMNSSVVAVLNGWRKKQPGDYFFSGFLPVGDYDVGVVLRLECPEGQVPYRLPRVHAEERFGTPASFLDAVIDEFLLDCRKALYRPEATYVSEMSERKTPELLRAGGGRMMDTPVWAAGNVFGLYGLFDSCNVISSLTYESAESFGGMLVARAEHPNIERVLTLKLPVPLRSYRAVRKMLQVAGHQEQLICNGAEITGLGHVRGNYNQADADLFEIQFTGHYRWELLHGGHQMMRVRYGNPELPLPPMNQAKLASDLQRLFRESTPKEIERLAGFAMQACKQRKGALLIISTDAENEARRLEKQATVNGQL